MAFLRKRTLLCSQILANIFRYFVFALLIFTVAFVAPTASFANAKNTTKKEGKQPAQKVEFLNEKTCPSLLDEDAKGDEPVDADTARLLRYTVPGVKNLPANLPERELLEEIAYDTWAYFRDVVDKETGLPLDNIMVFPSKTKANCYTSVTNIGLYIMCVVSAFDLGFIDRFEAVRRVTRVIESLEKVDKWEGHPYNYYKTITLQTDKPYVSTVDNGWLAAGIIVAKEAFQSELGERCEVLLKQMDFNKLYDRIESQFYVGYDGEKEKYSPYHYGLLCCESRVASYIAIGKGDVPRKHWFKLYRTLPSEWKWQARTPVGFERTYFGTRFFQGYYQIENVKFVPSWGGSMFEYLMPTLVLREQEVAKKGLGLNNEIAVRAQIAYAEKQKYPVWGISPCSTPENIWGYFEYGVEELGSSGYQDKGVITPHASFLALAVLPEQAIKNIRNLLINYPEIYGKYGFYDAVNVNTFKISKKYLCLDQAMTLIALNNYLNNGAIRYLFNHDTQMKAQEDMLSIEDFFEEN
ncbi:MAG: DUF3131 domain-containing protein [Endomicrobiales bacterium]|nr:DUF3131 domain-containing protein [Endomicrobiales bacterium]